MPFNVHAPFDGGEFAYDKIKNPTGVGVNLIKYIDDSGDLRYYHVKHAVAGKVLPQ